jgi:hypothetical protein
MPEKKWSEDKTINLIHVYETHELSWKNIISSFVLAGIAFRKKCI